MASGAPKKVLTVAMTLGLMASVLTTVPTPVIAQDDDQVVGGNAGAAVATGEETADLALLHTRANYNPRIKHHHPKFPPQEKLPRTAWVDIPKQENVVGDNVNFDVARYFRNFSGDLICVYGLPPGLRFDRSGRVVGQPTTQGKYEVRVLVKDVRRNHVVAESKFDWIIQPRNATPTVDVRDVAFNATGQEGTTELVPLNIADDQPIDTLKVTASGFPGARVVFTQGAWYLQVPTTNPAQHGVKVSVSDAYGATAEKNFSIRVVQQKVNQAPVVSFVPIAQQATGHAGTQATALIRALDDGLPNGQLTARPKNPLPAGWVFGGSNGQWSITVPSDKPIPLTGIEVIVSDGELETVVTVGICIWDKPSLPTYAPVGFVQPVSTVQGKPVNTGIFIYDVDTDIKKLNVEVVGDNPAGVEPKRNADGTWYLHVPATKITNGEVLTELKVTDDTGLSTTFPAVVTVNAKGNNAPTVFAPDVIFPEGQKREVGVTVTDEDPKSVKVEFTKADPNVTLRQDQNGGWVLVADGTKPLNTTVTLVATDNTGQKSQPHNVKVQTFRAQVSDLDPLGKQTVNVGTQIKPVQVKINNEQPGDSLEIVGLPSWLKFDEKSKTFTGAPTAPGTYSVTVILRSAAGVIQDTEVLTIEAKEVPNVKAPTGVVNPVVAFKGDPTVLREIFVDDADTDNDKLVVSLVKGPEGVSVVKNDDRWFLVVQTSKVVPTTQVDLKVSDGKHETGFSTSVTVKDRDPQDKTPSIDNPGGQTSEVGKPIKPLQIGTYNVPKGETPKVEGLPEGLTPHWDPNSGVITIDGTPSKPTDKPVNVTISVTNPNKPNDPVKVEFPWQVNEKGGNDFGPKGWVDPVMEKVTPGKKVEKPVRLADADTPIKDLKVTMTNKIDGVELQQKAPGEYVLVVDLSKKIDLTRALFQVTDGKYIGLFETTVLVEDDKTDQGNKYGPTGEVNPVIAFVGDPKVRREVFLKDADTKIEDLKLELVKGPDQAKLVKEGNRHFLEVTTEKALETTIVEFKVSDGKFSNEFNTTVTVKPRTPDDKTPSLDNPGGQTSIVGKPIDPVLVPGHNIPEGQTPKVEGLPEGLTPSYDPKTGITTITGTPSKETDKPANVVITVTDPKKPNDPVKVEFPWQVNPDKSKDPQPKYPPVGQVDSVHEKVGANDGKVTKPVKLHDRDTDPRNLVVTLTNPIEGVKLVQNQDKSWALEVSTAKVIPLTVLRFRVSDGDHTDLFENTVDVYSGTDQSDKVQIEVPDGKTTVNQPLPPLKVTVSNAKPEDVKITPALPDGIKYDPAKGEISGTPTKVSTTKHTAEVTNDKGEKATDDFTITVTDSTPAPNPSPSIDTTGISGTRIQGPTRVETAIAISRRQFKDQSVQSVVLARDDQYADANAGTPFADTKSAPVLLTQSGTLHPDVEKEIRRILKPGGEIWIMGREEAIHRSVEDDLVKKFVGHNVHRIGGINRYETAAFIYDRLGKPGIVSVVDGGNENVGDALVAGAAMAYKDGAVLYSALGKLAPETKPVFDNNKITTKYSYDPKVTDGFTLIGGKDAIARSISTATHHWGTTVNQIGVASSLVAKEGTDNRDNVVDALTGGAMIARRKSPMLLTPVDVNDKRLTEYVSTFSKSSLKKIWLYGGTQAVPQNVADALAGTGVKIQWDTFNWTDKTPDDPDNI